jgi:hypothetical protein
MDAVAAPQQKLNYLTARHFEALNRPGPGAK